MGVTISTHNGSSVAREHNIRNPKVICKEPHIDPNGIHETWIDEPIREAYDRLFGAAVEEYNSKQARPERRIKSYYNDVCKDSKKHPAYEMIIGIYGKNEDGSLICSAEQGKEIMRKFVDDWKRRNPNLELIGAYYHADEPDGEAPHVHIDYIPVAHGYKKGLQTQTGLVKALGEQGLEKKGKATAQIQWEQRENDYLTQLCEAVGLTVDHPKIAGRKHLETEEAKLKKRVEELKTEEVKLKKRAKAVNKQIEKEKNTLSIYSQTTSPISITYSEIERIERDKKTIPFSNQILIDKNDFDILINLSKHDLAVVSQISMMKLQKEENNDEQPKINEEIRKLQKILNIQHPQQQNKSKTTKRKKEQEKS